MWKEPRRQGWLLEIGCAMRNYHVNALDISRNSFHRFSVCFSFFCVTFTLGCCLCNWREGNPFGCGTDSPPSQPDSEEHHNHHHNHHHHHRYSLTGKNMAAKQGKILFWQNESLPGHGRGRQGRRSFSDRKSGGCEVGCNDNRVSDVVKVGRAPSREGLSDKELW